MQRAATQAGWLAALGVSVWASVQRALRTCVNECEALFLCGAHRIAARAITQLGVDAGLEEQTDRKKREAERPATNRSALWHAHSEWRGRRIIVCECRTCRAMPSLTANSHSDSTNSTGERVGTERGQMAEAVAHMHWRAECHSRHQSHRNVLSCAYRRKFPK